MSPKSLGYFLCDVLLGSIAIIAYFIHPALAIGYIGFLAARGFNPE